MPIQQLRLYDLLVDIIPGVVAILLFHAFIPSGEAGVINTIPPGLSGAVVLIILGFLVGRIVHYLSSISSDILTSYLFMPDVYPHQREYVDIFFSYLKKIVPVEDREKTVAWTLDYYPPEPNWYPQLEFPEYNEQLVNNLHHDLESKYDLNFRGNLGDFVSFAQSKLYSGDHLYNRYNILTTFFRNMSFLLWVFAVLTGIQGLMFLLGFIRVISPWMTYPYANSIPLVSLICGIIFSHQLQKYSTKRNRHLVIDLFQTIRSE